MLKDILVAAALVITAGIFRGGRLIRVDSVGDEGLVAATCHRRTPR